MSARGPYRRHSPEFKLQLCTDVRDGKLGRREAQKTYQISANLIQLWLAQHDRGELSVEEAAASTMAEYEAKIAALERKVGQLTMELDLVKNGALKDRSQQRSVVRSKRPASCSIRRGCQVIRRPERKLQNLKDMLVALRRLKRSFSTLPWQQENGEQRFGGLQLKVQRKLTCLAPGSQTNDMSHPF